MIRYINNGKGEGMLVKGCDKIGNMEKNFMDRIRDVDYRDVDNVN